MAALLYILFLQHSLHVLVLSQDSDCLYHWLQEPPSDVSCNPWPGSSTLRVQCQASVPASATAEIHWFFEGGRITGSSPQLQEINDDTVIDSSDSSKAILTSIAGFQNGIGGLQDGNYHCQILVNDNYTNFPSNVFDLLHESESDVVSRQPCNGLDTPYSISTDRCAGEANMPITSTPTPSSPLTTPPPTTPPPSSTQGNYTTYTVLNSNFADGLTSNPTIGSSGSPTSSALSSTESGETVQDRSFQMWLYILVAVIAVLIMTVMALSVGLCLRYKNCKRKTNLETQHTQLHSPINLERANEALPITDPEYDIVDEVMISSALPATADMISCEPDTTQNLAYAAFENQHNDSLMNNTNLPTGVKSSACAFDVDTTSNQAYAAFESGKMKNGNAAEVANTAKNSTFVTCAHNPAYALLGEPEDETTYQNVVVPWSCYTEDKPSESGDKTIFKKT